MQRYFKLLPVFLLLFLLPVLAKAQEDKIYLHNGQTIVGKILNVDDTNVTFVYLKMENVKCGRYVVEKIVYANGKTDVISNKIILASKDDWEKVRVLGPTEDISTLKYQGFVGDIRKPVTPAMMGDKEAIKKLKQEAAEKGFQFVQVSARKNIGYTYN